VCHGSLSQRYWISPYIVLPILFPQGQPSLQNRESKRLVIDLRDLERIEMPTHVNPDPHAEGFQLQPTNHLTTIIDNLDDALSAIRDLTRAGFSDNDLSLFIGKDGLVKLDLHGKEHGIIGRIVRAADSLTSNQEANQEAEAALKAGSAYLMVLTDGGEEQKTTAERILKAHNAKNVRYYGQWTVEPL